MATPLTGSNALLKSFKDGQSIGITNYFTYASDHDTNFTRIEATVNQLVAEVMAVQGPNAAVFADVVGLTDIAGPRGVEPDGVLGQHSYVVAIGSPTTELDISRGSAIVNTIRVELASPLTIVGPGGGAAWHYVQLDANGIPSINIGTTPWNLARVWWDSAAYTGTVFQEAEIFIDGDEYAELRRRPLSGDATTPTFPALDHSGGPPIDTNAFRLVANRILDIERRIAGYTAGQESGTTMGAVGIGGSVTAPGMITTDGSANWDTGTGFFRVSANILGVAVSTSEVLRFTASSIQASLGIHLPSNSATDGAVVFGAGSNAKAYYDGTDFQLITDLVAASDFLVDCGTDKTLELVETVWDDLRVALGAGSTGASNPPTATQFMDDGSSSIGVFAFEFGDVTAINENQMFFNAQLPHRYKQGTDLGAHIHWSPVSSGAAGEFVKWGLEYTWVNIDGTFGNTTIITSDASAAGTATTSGDASLTTKKHYITALGTISGSGKNISSMLICRVFRNSSHADDDLAAGAWAFEVDFHFEIDTMGSRQNFVK